MTVFVKQPLAKTVGLLNKILVCKIVHCFDNLDNINIFVYNKTISNNLLEKQWLMSNNCIHELGVCHKIFFWLFAMSITRNLPVFKIKTLFCRNHSPQEGQVRLQTGNRRHHKFQDTSGILQETQCRSGKGSQPGKKVPFFRTLFIHP